MNLSSAPGKAQALGAGADKSAARLYNDIEQELALGSYSEDDADAGESALSILEERFPGVRQAARNVTEPPKLSHSAKRTVDAGGADDEEDEDDAPERGDGGSGSHTYRSGRGDRAPRSRRSSSSGSFGSAFDRASGGAGGDLAGSIILGLQGLLIAGLVYQVLQPKGAGAFSSALSAVERGFDLIVQPIDPLGGGLSSQAALGAQEVQQSIAQATAAAPSGGQIDTPTGTISAQTNAEGLNLGGSGGNFDTPGGVAVYRPPSAPGLKIVTGPLGSSANNSALTQAVGRIASGVSLSLPTL